MSFKKGIAKQFGRNEILGSTLYDEDFYTQIVIWWKEEYFKIEKLKKLYLNSDLLHNSKQLKAFFYRQGMKNYFKDLNDAMAHVELWDKLNLFDNRSQKYRIKAELKRAFSISDFSYDSETIKELDMKIIESVKYCV